MFRQVSRAVDLMGNIGATVVMMITSGTPIRRRCRRLGQQRSADLRADGGARMSGRRWGPSCTSASNGIWAWRAAPQAAGDASDSPVGRVGEITSGLPGRPSPTPGENSPIVTEGGMAQAPPRSYRRPPRRRRCMGRSGFDKERRTSHDQNCIPRPRRQPRTAFAAALTVCGGFAAADEIKAACFPPGRYGKLYATGPEDAMILGEISVPCTPRRTREFFEARPWSVPCSTK
jgi:hypothetical protein